MATEEIAVNTPPNLQEWRERLFLVADTIIMTEEEWSTYWLYVDNIWSHRSTQTSKNGRIKTHYYDCRLKGRPTGVAVSLQNPDRKKRKRVARERDLCDMKIKITEAVVEDPRGGGGGVGPANGVVAAPAGKTYTIERVRREVLHKASPGGGYIVEKLNREELLAQYQQMMTGERPISNYHQQQLEDGVSSLSMGFNFPGDHEDNIVAGEGRGGPRAGSLGHLLQDIDRYGIPGFLGEVHRHSLEQSDAIKKSSIERDRLKHNKEFKKMQKTYHKKATGQALHTVKKRSKENELKLFGSCFCPFVQRVWIALELKGIDYQYIEVDPYAKPKSLLDVNPRGLVPALKHGDFACHESSVLMEYLEDAGIGQPLLPNGPRERAHARLWIDHINRNIVPGFYRFLQAQEQQKQVELAEELKNETTKLVDAADPTGPFFLGPNMTSVDVAVAPWFLRFSRVLQPYRGWPPSSKATRLGRWIDALETNEAVINTTSDDALYLDSYERYAENRPDTSQVANAVNSGRGLP